MQELLDKDIWAEARRKKGRGRITCAISYVNADHLRLRAGDRLICDASDGRIATGATSALVLDRMHKNGVALYHLPGLHAKVARMPGGVLLGSANMTVNSLSLFEAALLSDEPELVSQVDEYLRALLAQETLQRIGTRFLSRISKIPIVVAGEGRAAQRRRGEEESPRPRLWVVGSRPLSEKTIARTLAAISAEADQDMSDVPFMQWGRANKRARLVRLDDQFIAVDRVSGRAGRPERVVGVFDSARARLLVHTFAADTPAGSIKWERLRAVLQDAGLYRRSTGIPSLLQLDPQTEARVRALYRAAN